MTPPIGGMGGGMDAIGAMLARGQGAPASAAAGANGAPSAGSSASFPGAPAAGMDAVNQQLEATIMQIRQLGESVKQLAATNPLVADEAQQIQQLLKMMVVKSAQTAPVQTVSSEAVPTGMTA